MTTRTICGIDPGKTGGLVLLDNAGKILYIYTMPKIKNEIDIPVLFERISNMNADLFIIEKVHALHGSAAGATFDFGRTCGILEALVVATAKPYTLVTPKVWQAEMFEGIPDIRKPAKPGAKKQPARDTKKMAELAYQKLFPTTDLYLTDAGNKSKNVHDGLVDALLIAEYGRRNYDNIQKELRLS